MRVFESEKRTRITTIIPQSQNILMSVPVSSYLSIYQSFYLPIYLSTYICIYLSINLCCRPARLREGVDELVLEPRDNLLVQPTAGVVLKFDQVSYKIQVSYKNIFDTYYLVKYMHFKRLEVINKRRQSCIDFLLKPIVMHKFWIISFVIVVFSLAGKRQMPF